MTAAERRDAALEVIRTIVVATRRPWYWPFGPDRIPNRAIRAIRLVLGLLDDCTPERGPSFVWTVGPISTKERN